MNQYKYSRTFIKKNKERLITAVNNNIDKIRSDRKTTKTGKQKWEEKQMHGCFKRQTGKIALENTWTW